MRRSFWSLAFASLALVGCQSEPVSRMELRQTHYVLPASYAPPAERAQRNLALEAEWPEPYTVMRPQDEDVVRVRNSRWVQCDGYAQSFRLETGCADVGVVRVRSGYTARPLPSCESVVYRNRTYGAGLQPCDGRRSYRQREFRPGGYGSPVVVRVPQRRHRVGPPPVVIISR